MDILGKIQKIAEELKFDLVGIANTAISDEQLADSNEIACPNASPTKSFWRGSFRRASSPPAGGLLAMTKENEKLDEWVKNGYHADMKWFADSLEKRKDVLKVMPDAKSVICVAMNYYCDTNIRIHANNTNNTNGRIARYARGGDYHKIFDKKLKLFVKRLEGEILRYSRDDKQDDKDWIPPTSEVGGMTNAKFKYYCDTGPVLERMWAARAGLGFIGKNTNLITKYGSWVLLGEVITNIDIKNPKHEIRNPKQINTQCHPRECGDPETNLDSRSPIAVEDRFHGNDKDSFEFIGTCGFCRRCLDACPTGALVAPYTVDARKCISYLTIEHKGEIPVELREKMGLPGQGNRIFGCDACQEVCPFNIGRQIVGINFRKEADLLVRYRELVDKDKNVDKRGGADYNLKEILSIKTDEEFLKKFAGTPLMRAKRRGLVRNACIVAGNLRDLPAQTGKSLLPYLRERLKDKEPIIVSHAEWAIEKIGSKS